MNTRTPFARFFPLAAALGALLVTTRVQAQQVLPPPPPFLSYAAKFVCGPQSVDTDVVKGRYATTVNVHNPQATLPVQFFKKAVIALPERSNFGPISQGVTETLPPDIAIGIDCRDIISLFAGVSLPLHIEGFVVLEVPPITTPAGTFFPVLDVVAKYTARHRTGTSTTDPTIYDVETLAIVPITPQQITR